jgi:DNA invertase Pin-like site-specific DNA recombinase
LSILKKRIQNAPMMLVGYARANADDGYTAEQCAALLGAGCAPIYIDRGVGGRLPQLQRALGRLSRGDVLVVHKLDRLGRGIADVVGLVREIEAREAHLRSLCDAIDTTSTSGSEVFRVMAAIADAQRSQRGDAARGGMRAAKQRGRMLGRPPKLSPEQVRVAERRVNAGEAEVDVARAFGVSRLTLRRAFQARLLTARKSDRQQGRRP